MHVLYVNPGMVVVAAPESASLMSAWPTMCAHLLDLQRQFGYPNRAFTLGVELGHVVDQGA
jgi:hypothetical protein